MSSLLRRVTAIPVLAFVVASSALAVTAAPALADDANTLTVVGTSDVYDSNLVQAVIKPGFEAAYPGVTLNYVSKGTGAAIAYAEGGSASAMIVHAASLENQFVDQGYSLGGYGRAIFWGDYVLLGPANDPANVLNGSTHDIVGAFEKVAAAGKRGKANFVSRGGTPGTTVQEHALWALTSGVPACQVSDVNGGGKAPSTVSGACPTTTANPSWYHTTGLTQGPNILNGDACNYSGGGCYVFTDRGTFQYLRSQGSIANLAIQVRNNADTKRGKQAALVNSFHAYAVDPSKFADNPNVQLNPAAATDFLNWITSPDAQSAIGAYLATDPDKAPFIPDASPAIATSRPSATTVDAGTPFRLSGTITNKVPTAPVLAGETVVLRFFPSVQGGAASDVATTTTDANGAFSFTYRPSATGRYAVTTPPISKVEDDSLTPVFGDRLAAGTSAQFGPVTVNGLVTIRKVTAGPGSGIITGSAGLKPVNLYTTGNLDLYAAPAGDPDAALVMKGTVVIPVSATATTTSFRYRLPVGTWRIALHYRHPNVITEGVSDVTTVTVT